jgi:hypothetical protein
MPELMVVPAFAEATAGKPFDLVRLRSPQVAQSRVLGS